jgi:hypothetical protein
LVNLPLLEAQLAEATVRNAILSLHRQISDVEAHVLAKKRTERCPARASGRRVMPASCQCLDQAKVFGPALYQQAETIEPFYSELARLKLEAETGQVSRRTRSLAQNGVTPHHRSYVPRLPAPSAATAPGVVPWDP